MGKNKLLHFEENKTFPNFFQPNYEEYSEGYRLKGKWKEAFFKNGNPLILELGCGKGEYSVGLAEKYPDRNYIGVDKKGARMWRGAKTSMEERIFNVAFLRIKIDQIGYCFGRHEVDEVWITFPDPVIKKRREARRLTSPKFMKIYRTILKPDGVIHLKTDNAGFFAYTLEVIGSIRGLVTFQTDDLYSSGYAGDAPEIQTFYEKKYLEEGVPIKYLQFKFGHDDGKD